MKFIWRNCKYFIIFILAITTLSWLVYNFTDIPTELWNIFALFIGYGAAILDNRGEMIWKLN